MNRDEAIAYFAEIEQRLGIKPRKPKRPNVTVTQTADGLTITVTLKKKGVVIHNTIRNR